MKLLNTIKTLALVIPIISFTACGGGGGGGGSDSTDDTSPTQIEITVECVTNPSETDIESYITLESGDTISKTGEVTITTYHDSDGVKKVCKETTSTGSAFLVKGGL